VLVRIALFLNFPCHGQYPEFLLLLTAIYLDVCVWV
jgi:hypothetical protein